MRIDGYNPAANDVSSEASLAQAGAQSVNQSAGTSEQDRATLSSDSASASSLVGIALNSPEVRQGKVDSLTQSIQNGEYDLDPAKIASAMIDDYA
jgi:flagellar biosynthesis anti-sigma factor FlgM